MKNSDIKALADALDGLGYDIEKLDGGYNGNYPTIYLSKKRGDTPKELDKCDNKEV